ncbi:hypothetical protein QUA77_23175 [Microcoleus sp. K5-D4]
MHIIQLIFSFILLERSHFRKRSIVRLLLNLQRSLVGRFRSWSDADGHISILRQLLPEARLIVVFDPGDRS